MLRIFRRQAAGRLVKDNKPGIGNQCFGNLDKLLLSGAQTPDGYIQGNIRMVERGQRLADLLTDVIFFEET